MAMNGGDRIQLAPLRHHSAASSAMSVTSSAAGSPIMTSAPSGGGGGGSPDPHNTASYSVIQLRSPGREGHSSKMLPPPSDFGSNGRGVADRDRRGSFTEQRGAAVAAAAGVGNGKKNLLSIGSIISNSNDN